MCDAYGWHVYGSNLLHNQPRHAPWYDEELVIFDALGFYM